MSRRPRVNLRGAPVTEYRLEEVGALGFRVLGFGFRSLQIEGAVSTV